MKKKSISAATLEPETFPPSEQLSLRQFIQLLKVRFMDLFCFAPQCFLSPPVTNYMLLYSTLLCKKIARAPGGHKKFMLTKLGGGGGAKHNRSRFIKFVHFNQITHG